MPTPSDGARAALLVAAGDSPPAGDLEALGAVLRDPTVGGYDVVTLVDPTSVVLYGELGRFLAGRDANDVLLLYVCCPVAADPGGDLYLLAADADPASLRRTAVSVRLLVGQIEASATQHLVALVDDRNRPVEAALAAAGRIVVGLPDDDTVERVPRTLAGAVAAVLASGEADTDGDGLVTVDELSRSVSGPTGAGHVRPEPLWTDAAGRLVLARNPRVTAAPSALDDDVQFSVYRPRRIRPERWYPLLAFAHRTTPIDVGGAVLDPVQEVEQRARAILRHEPAPFDAVRADSRTSLPRGSDLLFEPWFPGGEVEPSLVVVRWNEPVHEARFRLTAPASADGQHLAGGVRVFVGAILVGETTFRVEVGASVPDRPVAEERTTVDRFRRIFASYSHADAEVVDIVARHVELLGDRYLRDTQVLRSGEEWGPRLAELIEEADVFQLFWSSNAMRSPFVRDEWQHALGLGREGFIRPVYWEDPLPADDTLGLPPVELRRLHFSRLAGGPPGQSGPAEPARTTVVCPACGHHNDRANAFCGACGSFLDVSGEMVGAGKRSGPPPTGTRPAPRPPPAPSLGHTPGHGRERPKPRRGLRSGRPSGDRRCPECGAGEQLGRRFCRRCGSELPEAEPAGPLRGRTPWWRRLLDYLLRRHR